jgi:hypothetical protein
LYNDGVGADCRKNLLRGRVKQVLKLVNMGILVGGLLSLVLVGLGVYGFIANFDGSKSFSDFGKQIPSTVLMYGVCASGVPVGGWLWIRVLRMKYGFVLEDTEGNCETHMKPNPACEKSVSALESLLNSPLKM